MTGSLTTAALRHFTGSESFYRHAINRRVLYTEGVQYVAEQGGAYWLLDEIALAVNHQLRLAGEGFQVWKLTVSPDHTGTLVCTDGNHQKLLTKPLDFTDFPLPEIELWAVENELGPRHFTVMLPSEY